MAKKSFTFVEDTDDDNGYDFVSGLLRIGEVDVKNVKELVDHVDKNVGKDDCIENITIIGHGRPGNISVGDGQSHDNQKRIGLTNENVWGPLLDKLACRFCKGGTVYLRGCNTGADAEGAQLLHRIKLRLKCAIVQASTGVCNPLYTTGKDQESKPDEKKPPKAIPNPDKKSKKDKKKKKKEKISKILGGSDSGETISFLPEQITGAVFLSATTGEPVSPWMIQKNGRELDEKQIKKLIKGLDKGVPKWYPNSGFDVDAYLQLHIQTEDGAFWLPPGAVMGSGTYYSAFGTDTAAMWVLSKGARNMLADLMESTLEIEDKKC